MKNNNILSLDGSTSSTVPQMTEEEYKQFIRMEYCRVINDGCSKNLFDNKCEICGAETK